MKDINLMLPVFVQMFWEGCHKDRMFGTKEHPVYICGYTEGLDEAGYNAYYTWEQASKYPGMVTPSFLRKYVGEGRVNLQIGDKLFRGIRFPLEKKTRWTEGLWEVRIEFADEVEPVIVAGDT